MLPLKSPLITGKSLSLYVELVCGVLLLLYSSNIYLNNNNIMGNGQILAPFTPSSPANNTGAPTIQITSPQDGQQVPLGELTIQGISSDNKDNDCKVFADVDDKTPMRNVTAAGDSKEDDDFSKWTFTYTQDYQLIKKGENELTAKITCLVREIVDGVVDMSSNGTSMSEWDTVNVTGVSSAVTGQYSFVKPTDSTIENITKTTQGNMIYQTKVDGDEWFMDPDELNKDKRFDANANLTRNRDGSWSVDSKEHTRLNVWTKGSGDFRQKGGMDTYNHSVIEARGFWYKPSDWKNTEMTGYFKLNEYVEDEYSTYSRSIWHNRTHNGCGGSDYRLKLHFDGSVSLDKEEWHVHYTEQPKLPPWMPEHTIIDGLGNLTNKWVGLKNIVYNIDQNSTSYPKMEMWIDQNNSNVWKKVYEYVDRRGWGSTMNRCGGAPDQLITWGSPVATFRWDDTADIDFRNLSVREIEPP